MRKFFTLICAALFFMASAFTPIRGLEDVINALRNGNANEVAKYIEDDVEISLPERSDSYSKAQSVMILKDFFANNRVTSFEVKHQGDNNGNQFCIGTLHTQTGDFRTTIFMKSKNGKQSVKELKFQPQ
jgi:hypothetical protein